MANRTFQLADQMAFAALSGDFNPMHVDERVARRLLFGKPVVHGIHAALWSLNEWCLSLDQRVALRRLRADFQRPILAGESVNCELLVGKQNEAEIRLRSGGRNVVKLRLADTSRHLRV